jgi:hypothetical protein
MTKTTCCDMCREDVDPGVIRYRVDRYDHTGYVDQLDICSSECLAVMATREAHARGAREEVRAQWQRVLRDTPNRRRRWRGGAR